MKPFLVFLFMLWTSLHSDVVQRAYDDYTNGEKAKTSEEKKEFFNKALAGYLSVEQEDASSALLFSIGNTYFQLKEYGYAIFYYYKALERDRRNERIWHNLNVAREKAGLEPEKESFWDTLLFFHTMFSIEEKVALVLIFLVFSFALISLYIWTKGQKLLFFSLCFFLIGLLFFTSLLYNNYLTPPDAIVVRPSSLRVDAGDEYARVEGSSMIPGVRVEVMGMDTSGNWIQVRLDSGIKGYVAKEKIRVIK